MVLAVLLAAIAGCTGMPGSRMIVLSELRQFGASACET